MPGKETATQPTGAVLMQGTCSSHRTCIRDVVSRADRGISGGSGVTPPGAALGRMPWRPEAATIGCADIFAAAENPASGKHRRFAAYARTTAATRRPAQILNRPLGEAACG